MIEPNEWIGDPTTGYQPDDPPQGNYYCERCNAWDEDCECPYDPEGDASNLELDKVEATCQWFDDLESARGDKTVGECPSRVHGSSTVPLHCPDRYWEEEPQYWDKKAESERRKNLNR